MTDDRTERALRRALDDAAHHVDVQAGSLPEPSFEPTEPPHRRRLAVAIGVAVVVALLAGSFAFVAIRDEGSSSVEVGAPDPVTYANADLEVFMTIDASEFQIAAVRDAIEADPDVTAYTSLDTQQQYAEFQVATSCTPGVGASASAQDFPASFRIRVRETTTLAVKDRLAAFPGVRAVRTRPDSSPPDTTTPAPTTLPTSQLVPVGVGQSSPAAGEPSTTAPTTTTVPRVSKEIPFVLPAPPDCRPEQTTTPTPTPTTVGLPPAGQAPADQASAETAVRDVWNRAFSASTPEAERWSLHEVFENHPELIGEGIPANQQYRDNIAVKVLDVVFVSPTRAAVRYQLDFPALGMTQPPYLGYAVLTDHGWRVATETTCALMALGSRPCPAGI